MKPKTLLVSTLLPITARNLLQKAAMTPETTPMARRKAIDAACRCVRDAFPQFFKQEK